MTDQRMTNPVKTFLLVICGYRQTPGQRTGGVRLWQKLNQYSGPTVQVSLRKWDTDWADFANWMQIVGVEHPKVLVAAYSWGVGNGFVELQHELASRSIDIDVAVLADGVYHPPSKWKFWEYLRVRWGSRYAFQIKVQSNVYLCHWAWQDNEWPYGHVVESSDFGKTMLEGPTELDCPHRGVDESEWWHDTTLTMAQRLLKPAKRRTRK